MPVFTMSSVNGKKGPRVRVPRKRTLSASVRARINASGGKSKKRSGLRGAIPKQLARAARKSVRKNPRLSTIRSFLRSVPRRGKVGKPLSLTQRERLDEFGLLYPDTVDGDGNVLRPHQLSSVARRPNRKKPSRKQSRKPARRSKVMSKRKKLHGKKKAAFLRRMRRGKLAKMRPNGVRRRRRGRKNPFSAGSAMARAHPGMAGKSMGRKGRRRKGGSYLSSLQSGPLSGGRKRRRKSGAKSSRRRPVAALSTKRRRKLSRVSKKIRNLSRSIKGGSRGHRRRTPARARLTVLRVQRRALIGGLSKDARGYIAAHGLSKVNRGSMLSTLKSRAQHIPTLIGHALAVVTSGGVFAVAGHIGGNFLADKFWGGQYKKALVPGVTLASGSLVAGLASMSKHTAKFSGLIFIGGVTGAAFNLLDQMLLGGEAVNKLIEAAHIPVPAGMGSALLPGLNLGPVDKRLQGLAGNNYVNPKQLGDYAPRANFQGYANRADFSGRPERDLKNDATLRRMEQLRGVNAGGRQDD